jgi:hypothetical protein
VAVDLSIAGRRFGYLVTAYSDDRGHNVACRCVCGRLIHVAAEALFDGSINSCGCQPAPRAYWNLHRELRAQLRREINFGIAKAR